MVNAPALRFGVAYCADVKLRVPVWLRHISSSFTILSKANKKLLRLANRYRPGVNFEQKSNESIGACNEHSQKVTSTFLNFCHGLPCANSKLCFTDDDEIAAFIYL